MTKEELRKEFDTYFSFDGSLTTDETRIIKVFTRESAFNYLYSKIEEKDKEIEALEVDIRAYRNGHEVNAKRYINLQQQLKAKEVEHKVELSNYAYQMDLAKRERDKAEAAYQKCIDVIKRFDAGIISMYNL